VPPEVCEPDQVASTAERTSVLEFEFVLVSNLSLDDDGGLTTAWGQTVSSELEASVAAAIEVDPSQVFAMSFDDVQASRRLHGGRRLSDGGSTYGFRVGLVLNVYPQDVYPNSSALLGRIADLGTPDSAASGAFVGELESQLSASGSAIPDGLGSAVTWTSTPEEGTAILTQAFWIAASDWGECSSTCGEGQQTRTVVCSNGNEYLCNANSPPSFDQELFMPDVRQCHQHTACPFDWTCPGGPDANTGEGCEQQREVVYASVGGVAAVLLAVGILFGARRRRARQARQQAAKASHVVFDLDVPRETDEPWESSVGLSEIARSLSLRRQGARDIVITMEPGLEACDPRDTVLQGFGSTYYVAPRDRQGTPPPRHQERPSPRHRRTPSPRHQETPSASSKESPSAGSQETLRTVGSALARHGRAASPRHQGTPSPRHQETPSASSKETPSAGSQETLRTVGSALAQHGRAASPRHQGTPSPRYLGMHASRPASPRLASPRHMSRHPQGINAL
jgi:hypothetical protein